MSDIKIIPIFDQSAPGIWDDFLRIQSSTMLCNYKHCMTADYRARMLDKLQASWRRISSKFAFAAYDGTDMVGCIHGDCARRTATVRHLYVLPEYQHHHIGSKLLTAAEESCSLSAAYIELVSLAFAMGFYERNGYISLDHSNNYTKNITASGRCKTTPVFFCNAPVFRECREIMTGDMGFDVADINRHHHPMYVYRDIKSDIAGYGLPGTGANAGANHIVCRNGFPNDWARSCIERQLKKYSDFINLQKQR